jgi:HAE1 family hydrophobic/amphiphilic exporter-1
MNLSELCIRRPVMVVLLSATLILAGVLAYFYIPVAALSYNTPVINVSADLPGARRKPWRPRWRCRWRSSSPPSPACLITSTNTLGNSSLTLEFDPSINVNEAAVDVQAALLRAQRQLPIEMTDAVLPQGQSGRCAGAVHDHELAVADAVGTERLRGKPDRAACPPCPAWRR